MGYKSWRFVANIFGLPGRQRNIDGQMGTFKGEHIPVLRTKPNCFDNENTVFVRTKNIPLSVEDANITRTLTLICIEIIQRQIENTWQTDQL